MSPATRGPGREAPGDRRQGEFARAADEMLAHITAIVVEAAR